MSLDAFTVVMATGVVALAVRNTIGVVSEALAAVAVAASLLLLALSALRMMVDRGRVIAKRSRPDSGFDGFALIAGAGVLCSLLDADGHVRVGTALAAVCGVGWAVSLVVLGSTLVAYHPRLGAHLSGSSLLAVVAAQSVAIVAASTARVWD